MSIHPTTIIDPEAEVDSDVEIGPFCVVDAHVRVAAGCRLHHGVFLTGWTRIGENCELHPGVIVGHEPQDTRYDGARSYCRIGRSTTLREYVTIHRGTTPDSETVVGEECFLLGGAHVAHNCVVGDRVTLVNNVLLGGHATIGSGATLGGGAVVHQFVRIGELAMIPGQARVTKDVVPFALMNVEGRVAGLNRVGLRRAGVPDENVAELRRAYRVLFGGNLSIPQVVERLAGASWSGAAKRLVRFLEEESKRGLAGRSRAGRRRSESEDDQE